MAAQYSFKWMLYRYYHESVLPNLTYRPGTFSAENKFYSTEKEDFRHSDMNINVSPYSVWTFR